MDIHQINNRQLVDIDLETRLFFKLDNINHVDYSDMIALCDSNEQFKKLIQDGANIQALHPISELSPLGLAIKNKSIDFVRILLSHGADPNDSGNEIPPLLLAVIHLPEVIQTLIYHGADSQMVKANLENQEIIDLINQEENEIKKEQNLKNETTSKANFSDYMAAKKRLSQYPDHAHQEDMVKELEPENIQSSLLDADDEKIEFIDEKDDEFHLKRRHVLFDYTLIKKEISNEKNDAKKHYLKRMLDSGACRKYRKANTQENLDTFYHRFPNFKEVLDNLSDQFALATLSDNSIFSMRPILLLGPPGVGKTHFMSKVAKHLGFEFTNISCGGITAGWILSGSSVSWSDGRPGMVHTSLRDGQTANPFILLDEIDKLSCDQRFSGFGPLFQLLDKESAKLFSDEAVGVPMDCSQITWIATANNLDPIPEAILSRFTVIEVDTPSQEQIRQVTESIYQDIIEENFDSWGQFFNPKVNEDMMAAVQNQPPREIVKLILAAMGRAARRVNDHNHNKFDIKLQLDDFREVKSKKQKIGF